MTTTRLRGTIERIPTNPDGTQRGFAFIRTEDAQTVFLHIRNIQPRVDAFTPGTRLEFELVPGPKPNDKPCAVNCKVL